MAFEFVGGLQCLSAVSQIETYGHIFKGLKLRFRLQCLSAVSQIETAGMLANLLPAKLVSSAFRRCLRSRPLGTRCIINGHTYVSPVPFGGVSDRDTHGVSSELGRFNFESPVPFGGVSDRDNVSFSRAVAMHIMSPVPFGGVSDRDSGSVTRCVAAAQEWAGSRP